MGDSAFEGMERWLAELRAREAADAKIRERWLRQQAEEEAALVGLLLDLAERDIDVVAVCVGGTRHVGRIDAVGDDFVAVRIAGRRLTLVSLGSLAFVRPTGPTPGPTAGHRGEHDPHRRVRVSLADVLTHAVGDRPRVRLTFDAATVTGELRAVGADVLTVHADGDPPGVIYARLASLSEVSLLASG